MILVIKISNTLLFLHLQKYCQKLARYLHQQKVNEDPRVGIHTSPQ